MLAVQYLLQIAGSFQGFKRKRSDLYCCRCPYCGDSKTDRTRTRGYFYVRKGKMRYMCHNCTISLTFEEVLKDRAPELYTQYKLELFKDSATGTRREKQEETIDWFDYEEKKKSNANKFQAALDALPSAEHCLLTNTRSHFIEYLQSRKIPRKDWRRIYYAKSFPKLVSIFDPTAKIFEDSRMCMAYKDELGTPFALFGRSLDKSSKKRYLNINPDNRNSLIFGLETHSKTKATFVTEGPLDSLFLPNCLGATGTHFVKTFYHVNPEFPVYFVTDNQPRNPEVVKSYRRMMDLLNKTSLDWRIFLAPTEGFKDVNDMVTKLGLTNQDDRVEFIKSNSYGGLMAKLKFSQWAKV